MPRKRSEPATELATAGGPEGPPLLEHQPASEAGQRGVALLLAAAAVAAAVVGARVSFVSGDASGHWQSTVRLEVKRSTGAQENVRYLYETEVPVAIQILRSRLVLQKLEAIPAAQGGTSDVVAIEKSVQTEILRALEPSLDLTKPAYSLSGGGVDLGKRLADLRAAEPDILAVDPNAAQAAGNRLSNKAVLMSLALVPFGVCGMLGALAQAFASRRRVLLRSGAVTLAAGLLLALAVELAL
ncbi:MAG: hypothetical protein ABSE70_00315 [Candidatus Limnocylindrales bacterium]